MRKIKPIELLIAIVIPLLLLFIIVKASPTKYFNQSQPTSPFSQKTNISYDSSPISPNPTVKGEQDKINYNSQNPETTDNKSNSTLNSLRHPPAGKAGSTLSLVSRIIDGDTIELSTGQKVRLIGIDTPESGQPYFQEAKEALSSLILNKKVTMEKDVSETDKYGRLLRYIYLDDLFINEEMVRRGFARVYTYPPDVKYTDLFKQAEAQARTNQIGLWSPVAPTSNQCLIKGNISSSGEKIYHVPGGAFYDKTHIDESQGERWFCSEQDAQASGWRKSSR